jgi:hypothetical protein
MEGVKNAMAKLTLRWPTIATTRPVLISAHPWHSRRRDDSTRSVVSSFRGGLIKLKRPGLLTRVGAPWFVVRTLDLSDFCAGQSQSTERLKKRPLEKGAFSRTRFAPAASITAGVRRPLRKRRGPHLAPSFQTDCRCCRTIRHCPVRLRPRFLGTYTEYFPPNYCRSG